MSKITEATYDLMLEEMKHQDPIHRPTEFWANALEVIGDEMRGGGIAKFRSLPGPKRCFVPGYGLESLQKYGADFVAEVQKEISDRGFESKKDVALFDALSTGHYLAQGDFRTFIAGDDTEKSPDLSQCNESGIGGPDDQVCFDGRTFSRSMLNYLNGLVFLKEHVPDTSVIKNVLEIGGGFGSLGEILFHDKKSDYRYVNIDIPPAGYASSYYLAQIYGDEKFLSYEEVNALSEININEADFRAAVIAPWQMEKLNGTFDLFVNFISFQEMEMDVVESYADGIVRLGCRYVLLRNLREGKPKRSEKSPLGVLNPIYGEDYDRIFEERGYKKIATNVHPYGFETVDGFHSELRLYGK